MSAWRGGYPSTEVHYCGHPNRPSEPTLCGLDRTTVKTTTTRGADVGCPVCLGILETGEVVTPKRNLRFEHKHQIVGSPLAGTARPNICKITRIRNGPNGQVRTVWYRNESGFLSVADADKFLTNVVGRWLP